MRSYIVYDTFIQKNPPSHTPGKWRIKSNSIQQVLYFINLLGCRDLTHLSQAHLFLLYKLPCLLLRKGKLLHNFLYNSLTRGAHLSQHFNKTCDSTLHSLFQSKLHSTLHSLPDSMLNSAGIPCLPLCRAKLPLFLFLVILK